MSLTSETIVYKIKIRKEFIDELYDLINDLIGFKTETQNYEEILKCLNYIKDYLGDNIHAKIYQVEGQYCLLAINKQKNMTF